MTPVALWTGRLPGLRPLPRRRTLGFVGGLVVLGAAGAFGLLGPEGPWLGVVASLAAGWTVWRHRWPTVLPARLKPPETPHGPDERAVMVEIRHDRALLGWDVGILWFERGGVGFVGRTVSFVLPRAMMAAPPGAPAWQSTLRAPQMTAKVFETNIGIVPLARELNAQMTLARIDALPETVTSETILPPSSMHPDLIARGLEAKRRLPTIYGLFIYGMAAPNLATILGISTTLQRLVGASFCPLMCALFLSAGTPLPRSVRERLPKNL